MPDDKALEENSDSTAPAVESTTDSTEEQPDKNEQKKLHGKSFIYLALEDAENAARKIDEHARRMSKQSFAQALGHSKPIGRFTHKLMALENFGLITSDGDNVLLTDLAVEMLYGPTQQVRARARATAFLSYDLFNETFVQCPKNQDHKMSFVEDFVRVTLRIVNDRDTFMKRFLESAHYAGLLKGEPNPKAQIICLLPAVASTANSDTSTNTKAKSPDDQWEIVPPTDIVALLAGMGLTSYQDHCDVSQQSTGQVAITMADGKITIEVRRPLRIAIRTNNMLSDVTEILKSLQAKGFKA